VPASIQILPVIMYRRYQQKNYIAGHNLMLCNTFGKLENRLKVRFWYGILQNWHPVRIFLHFS
jgi:hypothetical protein